MQRYLALFASLSLAAAVYPNEAYPNGCWYAARRRRRHPIRPPASMPRRR